MKTKKRIKLNKNDWISIIGLGLSIALLLGLSTGPLFEVKLKVAALVAIFSFFPITIFILYLTVRELKKKIKSLD